MTAWYVVSTVLGVIWIIVLVVGSGATIAEWTDTGEFPADEFRIFAAVMAFAAVFVVAHWIILLLIIPVFFLYGLYAGVRLLLTRPWRQ